MNRFLSAATLLALALSAAPTSAPAALPACLATTPYYLPSSCHWLYGISVFGDELSIEDGSVWKVQSCDSYKLASWQSTDYLVLTPNNEWFSSYHYRIINKTTNVSIAVNLFQGPLLEGPYSRFVSGLERGHAVLTDSTRWAVCPRDDASFQEWMPGDCVIIGTNAGGWEPDYESILINVNMNRHVRAKQF